VQYRQLAIALVIEPKELAVVSALAIAELAAKATPKTRQSALRFMVKPSHGCGDAALKIGCCRNDCWCPWFSAHDVPPGFDDRFAREMHYFQIPCLA
jgi:hypothetical protein